MYPAPCRLLTSPMSPVDPAVELQNRSVAAPSWCPISYMARRIQRGRLDWRWEVVTCRSHWPDGARCPLPCSPAQYLVQVVGARVYPLAENIPLLPSEQAPERGQATDLQAVQPGGHGAVRARQGHQATLGPSQPQEPGLQQDACRGREHTPTWRRRHRSSRCGR